MDGWTSLAVYGDLRTQCAANISAWSNKIQALERRWSGHFKKAANAYRLAFKNFKDTVKAQEKIDAAWKAVWVHLAFGLGANVLKGSLSILSTHLKTKGSTRAFLAVSKQREYFFEGAENAIQTMVGKGVDSAEAQYLTYKKDVPFPTVNTDPGQFGTDLDASLATDFGNFYEWIAEEAKKVANAPQESFKVGDPEKLEKDFDDWINNKGKKHVGKPPNEENYNDPTHMTPNLQDNWEKEIWAKWVQKLYKRKRGHTLKYGSLPDYDDWISPGSEIEKRLTLLGIADEAGITKNKRGKDEDWGWWYTSDSEIKKLVVWGRGYKSPEKFG